MVRFFSQTQITRSTFTSKGKPSLWVRSILSRLRLIVLLILALSLCACSKEHAAPENSDFSVDTSSYKTYQHKGLSMHHPAHWTVKFDGAPDFSNDRAVIFELSELSQVTVFIYPDTKTNFSAIADKYENRLQLTSKASILDYQRIPVNMNGFKGLKLSWQESEIFARKVEVTILELIDSSSQAFIVFDLDEEDFELESPAILPVIKSIQLQ